MSRTIGLDGLASRAFRVELLVAPAETPVESSASTPASPLGIPLIEVALAPRVSCASAAAEPAGACSPVGATPTLTGHFRVLAVNGFKLPCERNIIVHLSGQMRREEPACHEELTYSTTVDIGFPIRFAELTYGASLLECSEVLNGRDISVDVTVRGGAVSVTIAGRGITFDGLNQLGIPDGTTVRVNLHFCGSFVPKGARAELYFNGQRLLCKELFGDCDC